ncbi:MAG TPA: SRPBCC family protein, partial [Gemmatimonadaceae bacterium]|nr:SRPBCC family protein [Gemmatimonadaceae bacterium]
ALMEAGRPATALREVRSAVIIDAPAHIVWRSVVEFPPLPEPSQLLFRSGVAYPLRAEIVGTGVGAVRYCVFSTGAFVEPITRWEPGRRLSFDVTEQPPPLQEWSPYAEIAPPHLDGYFVSRRGEFRLVPLQDGRTRLEGSTWYEMRLYPAAYWVIFGDAIVGRIHDRVLQHVRATAEAGVARPATDPDP